MLNKITCLEMEITLNNYLTGSRMIVPNVSWGMFSHECDLISVSKSGYCTEIEIKISAADLKKDLEKSHGHHDYNNKIKYLYFAIPEYLEKEKYIEYIPKRAGILIVYEREENLRVREIRKPTKQSDYKMTESETTKILWLMHHRIWGLKSKLLKLEKAKNANL